MGEGLRLPADKVDDGGGGLAVELLEGVFADAAGGAHCCGDNDIGRLALLRAFIRFGGGFVAWMSRLRTEERYQAGLGVLQARIRSPDCFDRHHG